MRDNRNNAEYLRFLVILYFTICHNVSNASWIGVSNYNTDHDENSNAQTQTDGEFSEVKHFGENSNLNAKELGLAAGNKQFDNVKSGATNKIYRHKRSSFLIIPLNDQHLSKRIFSDYGYGSRLRAGSSLAKLSTGENLFGVHGPGKRSLEISGVKYVDNDADDARDKRIASDYGYGSRVHAVENVANSLNKNRLFGIYGPGKRSYTTDFGYGSRTQALEDVVNSMSHGSLFGLYGPGKRSVEYSDKDIQKRISTDYGYGSRLKAMENMALSSTKSGLFGIHGPGKRSVDRSVILPNKRILSDFGYGSREQIVDALAQNSDKDKVFGIFGPGKRAYDTMSGDSGYGSRINAGSQIARDISIINSLFGLHGPGRKRRSAFN